MTKTKVQCSGITTKNQRCKIRVSDGNFCSYHFKQDPKYQNAHSNNHEVSPSQPTKVSNMGKNEYYKNNLLSAKRTTWDYIVTVKKENQKGYFIKQLVETTNAQIKSEHYNANAVYKPQEAKGSFEEVSDVNIYYKQRNTEVITTSETIVKLEKTETHLSTKVFDNNVKQPNSLYNLGSIYIYTYKHLGMKSPTKKNWINIKPYQLKDMEVFNPKYFTLIKVGFTKQSVKRRLKQWNDQCEHDITLVDVEFLRKALPSNLKILSANPSIFANYKSEPEKKTLTDKEEKQLTTRLDNLMTKTRSKVIIKNEKLTAFKDGEGFKCKSDAAIVEKKIHKFLGNKYGRILMNCETCSSKSEKGKSVHTEWFLIPKLQLVNVFYAIDKFCSEY